MRTRREERFFSCSVRVQLGSLACSLERSAMSGDRAERTRLPRFSRNDSIEESARVLFVHQGARRETEISRVLRNERAGKRDATADARRVRATRLESRSFFPADVEEEAQRRDSIDRAWRLAARTRLQRNILS
jgi:hypothetical protein